MRGTKNVNVTVSRDDAKADDDSLVRLLPAVAACGMGGRQHVQRGARGEEEEVAAGVEEEEEDAVIELVLDMHLSEVQGAEDDFKRRVARDVARAVAGDVSKVKRPGIPVKET